MFRALVVDRDAEGQTLAAVRQLSEKDLPDGDVLVAVTHSTVNYKDGLCLGSGGGLVKVWPHVPGIDFAGRVLSSDHPRWDVGQEVILTGWRVGEVRFGGYAEHARVMGDWLVAMPEGLDAAGAMAIGTAGLTAALALQALEDHGLTQGKGPVLVTGAAGGVGSVAVALLAALGYEVAAVTGRAEAADYLKGLGAAQIIPRSDLDTPVARPLERETWAGCIDSVGSTMLARVLGQMKAEASVAAVGLAGGADLPASVVPFLLRGINLLGIDSVMMPIAARERAWARLASALPKDKLLAMTQVIGLADVPEAGAAILKGAVRGRIVVDLSR